MHGRAFSDRSPACGEDPAHVRDPERKRVALVVDDSLALRRSYRCDCGGERWSERPGRLTKRRLDVDPGEQILASIETATGERPDGCPWYALRHPFVLAVLEAHRWAKLSELGARDRLPEALVRGVRIYDAALNGIEAHDIREDRENERIERALLEGQGPGRGGAQPHRGPAGIGRPRPRR